MSEIDECKSNMTSSSFGIGSDNTNNGLNETDGEGQLWVALKELLDNCFCGDYFEKFKGLCAYRTARTEIYFSSIVYSLSDPIESILD